MAAAMRVTFESNPPLHFGSKKGDVAVLKLYDQRFATELRQFYRAEPHDQKLEDEYTHDLLINPPITDEHTTRAPTGEVE